MSGGPILTTQGLTRHFHGLKAVENVDFALERGEVRALIGPNGAGKTTFVSLLCGRIAPTSGAVHFDGADITALPAHRRIRLGMAYTFQITSIFTGLPVAENIALAARDRDVSADAALERVGLDAHRDVLAGDLSYGHQRLLEIAMGLVQAPRLLILDEPTLGLSPRLKGELREAIAAIAAKGVPLIVVEQDVEFLIALSDRLYLVEQGEVASEINRDNAPDHKEIMDMYFGEQAH